MSTVKWRLAQWLELRWWKRYLGGKDKPTYLQWKKAYWHTVLQQASEALPTSAEQTIADFCCGPAGVFMLFAHNPVTAIDPLIGAYEQHTKIFAAADYSNVHFVVAPMEDTDPQWRFDRVFCMNGINHVRDIRQACDVLVRATAPGGVLTLSADMHNFSFFKHLFRLIPGDALHPHQYDLAAYRFFLQSRGMTIKKTVVLKKEFLFSHVVLVAVKNTAKQ